MIGCRFPFPAAASPTGLAGARQSSPVAPGRRSSGETATGPAVVGHFALIPLAVGPTWRSPHKPVEGQPDLFRLEQMNLESIRQLADAGVVCAAPRPDGHRSRAQGFGSWAAHSLSSRPFPGASRGLPGSPGPTLGKRASPTLRTNQRVRKKSAIEWVALASSVGNFESRALGPLRLRARPTPFRWVRRRGPSGAF